MMALVDRDRERDLVTLREPREHARALVLVPVEVRGRVGGDLEGLADRDEVLRLRRQRDRLPGLHLGAGDVDPLAVERDVAVGDQLAGLAGGEREAEPQADRVQTRLELADQLLAGHALERVARS